jgi:hypothetical protein
MNPHSHSIVVLCVYFQQDLVLHILRDKREVSLTVQPVDLATRLKEVRKERQQQLLQERLRFQEMGPFRSLFQGQ